jgi:DNA-binding transcriptional ArsR family regulator
MADDVPPFTRPAAFAATELMLDLFYTATKYYQLDLEAIWILTMIGHETMRPWILDPTLAAKHMTDARVPDAVRGSISRLMVADRTGLPRETVRRRIAELLAAGFVTADEKGNVRLAGDKVVRPAYQQSVADVYSAVERYRKRLASLAAGTGEGSAQDD